MRAWIAALLPLALGPNAGAAELCIVPSAANGANVTVTCGVPLGLGNGTVGYRTDGPPCDTRFGSGCWSDGDAARWTISASSSDPFVNTGPLVDPDTLYLWLDCTRDLEPVAFAEFALAGDLNVIALEPMNGFSNTGTLTELFLVATGCPTGPLLAAAITVGSPVTVASTTWARIKATYR
jgi:hypothetical protein